MIQIKLLIINKSIDYFSHTIRKDYQLLVYFKLLLTFYGLDTSLYIQQFIYNNTLQQKTFSTSYFIVEIFIQNLFFQIIFTLVAYPFEHISFLNDYLISYGWTPLIIIFLFKLLFRKIHHQFSIICCFIPKKYLGVVILVTCFLTGFKQFVCLLLATALGYLQFGYCGKHFISLPLKFYKLIDRIVPNCIKNNQTLAYIPIQDAYDQLIKQCRDYKGQQYNQNGQQKMDIQIKQKYKIQHSIQNKTQLQVQNKNANKSNKNDSSSSSNKSNRSSRTRKSRKVNKLKQLNEVKQNNQKQLQNQQQEQQLGNQNQKELKKQNMQNMQNLQSQERFQEGQVKL